MFKLFVFAAIMAIAAAKPGLVGAPVAYTAPVVSHPLAYSAYTAGYASPYTAGYASPYTAGYASPYAAYSAGYASPLAYSSGYVSPYSYSRYVL